MSVFKAIRSFLKLYHPNALTAAIWALADAAILLGFLLLALVVFSLGGA
jgi:hypothetical protein